MLGVGCSKSLFRWTTALLLSCAALHAAEPAEAFRPWSAFEHLDLEKLAKGKIITQSNAAMKFARGISTQAVYVVAAPVESAARTLLTSDPTKHPELDTYQHRLFQNEREADFDKIKPDPKLAPVRHWLEMMKSRDGFQLSRDETARLPANPSLDEARTFWSALLRERWSRFATRGDLGGTAEYNIRKEFGSLLAEEKKIAEHFAALLAPLTQEGSAGAPAGFYWDLSNVNKTATFDLGAQYTRSVDGRRQLLELTFYASSGYLASATIYEMQPITLDGQPRTLVWEGCLVSSVELAGGFGLKRPIAARLMLGDLEDSIRLFQQDAAAAH